MDSFKILITKKILENYKKESEQIIQKELNNNYQILDNQSLEFFKNLKASTYDFIAIDLLNVDQPTIKTIINQLYRISKQAAKLLIISNTSLVSFAKLAGYHVIDSNDNINNKLTKIVCERPKYDIGSSVEIKLNKSTEEKNIKSVWKIASFDDDEKLDENDLIKDDLIVSSIEPLKTCGTTGQRKACKDCTCGLAEELVGEKDQVNSTQNAKSSCGNCYLGDAFRCSTCPYLGMPAFKPGEKIELNLTADI